MDNKNIAYIEPVSKDNSEDLKIIQDFNIKKEVMEITANNAIIKIEEDLDDSKKTSKRNFIITLIISIMTLLIAIATFITQLLK